MVQVRIRIEASTTVDPYLRYHGKAVNQALNIDFWDTQPEKVIGTTFNSFSHEQTVDLPAGSNYVIYGNSSIEGYEWHARIYVNGSLVAEGDVHRGRQLRADFTVGAPLTYTLTLDVSYDPVGEAIDFEGYLYEDTRGIGGYGIVIYRTDAAGNIIERVYYTVTDVTPAGHYYGYILKQDIPPELWGQPLYFRSYSESHGIYSPVRSVTIPAPPAAVLSVTPSTVEARGAIAIEWSGFVDGYDIYVVALSGPPEYAPYPHKFYRVGNTSSGRLDTYAPAVEGVYEWQAQQEVTGIKSNIVTVTITPPAPMPAWTIPASIFLGAVTLGFSEAVK